MRALIASLVLVAGVAGADEDKSTAIAKSRFHLGELLYTNGHFAEAAAEFEAARAIQPRPDFDFNIARCHERMNDWAGAIEAYTRYVEATPTPLDAEKILAHIEQLRARGNLVAAPPPAPAPLPSGKRERLTGVILAAVGVAGLGVGIGFAAAGDDTADALTARDRAHLAYDAAQDRELSRDRAVEGALLAVGVAGVLAGATSYLIGYVYERRARRSSLAAQPGAALSGARGFAVRF